MRSSLRQIILCTALCAALPVLAQSQSYNGPEYLTAGANTSVQGNDRLSSLTLVVPRGTRTMADAGPAYVSPSMDASCVTLDDGGPADSYNDHCATSQADQNIGPTGYAGPRTIDLRGVNFDFDRADLRPDAIQTLGEDGAILHKYPQLRVEVTGHTDSIGSENYNQGLSERRAAVVHDYLTDHGTQDPHLMGPVGYGEAYPIAPNTSQDGRARNRRTEINVVNAPAGESMSMDTADRDVEEMDGDDRDVRDEIEN